VWLQRIRNIAVMLAGRPERKRLRLRVSAITPRARLRRDYSSQGRSLLPSA